MSKAATEVVDSIELSQALFGEKSAAISQLRALANECAELGWDGESASAMDSLAVLMAERFLRALWGRSAPHLPYGQFAFGEHGLRYAAPKRNPSPLANPGASGYSLPQ